MDFELLAFAADNSIRVLRGLEVSESISIQIRTWRLSAILLETRM